MKTKKNTTKTHQTAPAYYCPATGQPIHQAARMQRCGICNPALGIYPSTCEQQPLRGYRRAVVIQGLA